MSQLTSADSVYFFTIFLSIIVICSTVKDIYWRYIGFQIELLKLKQHHELAVYAAQNSRKAGG